jgi:hypothetical protein
MWVSTPTRILDASRTEGFRSCYAGLLSCQYFLNVFPWSLFGCGRGVGWRPWNNHVVTAEQPTIVATTMGFNRSRQRWKPGLAFEVAFELAGNPRRPRLCFMATAGGDQPTALSGFYGRGAEGGGGRSSLEVVPA